MCPAPCSLTGGWWKRQAAGFPLAGPAADSRRLGEWAGPDRSGRNRVRQRPARHLARVGWTRRREGGRSDASRRPHAA